MPEPLALRPLRRLDCSRGVFDLLSQLTTCPEVSEKDFSYRFDEIVRSGGTYFIVVLEDDGKLVGMGTLVLERKFIRSLAIRAMIEDVVVCESRRGQRLGQLIVKVLAALAKKLGAYKINLTCNNDTKGFYDKLGFSQEDGSGVNMTMRF